MQTKVRDPLAFSQTLQPANTNGNEFYTSNVHRNAGISLQKLMYSQEQITSLRPGSVPRTGPSFLNLG